MGMRRDLIDADTEAELTRLEARVAELEGRARELLQNFRVGGGEFERGVETAARAILGEG
jgi:hypothetical protein